MTILKMLVPFLYYNNPTIKTYSNWKYRPT